jgi:outer membrane protein
MTRWRLTGSMLLALPVLLVAHAAAPAGSSVLEQAWQGVLAQSPEYAAARARRDAGVAASAAARALWMPTIAAEGGLGRRSVDSVTSGAQFSAPGFGTTNDVDFRTSVNDGNAYQWGVVLQQPLLDAGRVADAAALRSRARAAEAQFRLTEQSLMVRTAEALAAVVEVDARFKATRRQHEAAQRERDQAQARFESGDMPVTEWREAQAQLDALAVNELDAQQALAVATAAYTDLTGLAAPATAREILPPPSNGSPDSVAAVAAARKPIQSCIDPAIRSAGAGAVRIAPLVAPGWVPPRPGRPIRA